MSIVSLSTGEPTCTLDDVKAIASASGFTIPSGSLDETAFLLFANAFDATCDAIGSLPEYVDPRLVPASVEGGERTCYTPDASENPLNAWAQKATLRLPNTQGPLSGRTIVVLSLIHI